MDDFSLPHHMGLGPRVQGLGIKNTSKRTGTVQVLQLRGGGGELRDLQLPILHPHAKP